MAEQERYQVRFDWSVEGARAIGHDADVIVWVDAITRSGTGLPIDELPARSALIEASMTTAAAAAQ